MQHFKNMIWQFPVDNLLVTPYFVIEEIFAKIWKRIILTLVSLGKIAI